MPSGTMANRLSLRAHTEPGDEILVEASAHLYYYECGGPAALSGVMCRCLPGVRGIFTGADVEAALRPPDQHFPTTKLVCVENTHNRGGGKIWSIEQIQESPRRPANTICACIWTARDCGTRASPAACRSAITPRCSTR